MTYQTAVCRYILIDAVPLQTHSVTQTTDITNLLLLFIHIITLFWSMCSEFFFNLASLGCTSVSCGSLRYIRIDVLMAFVRTCSGTLHVQNLVYAIPVARKVFWIFVFAWNYCFIKHVYKKVRKCGLCYLNRNSWQNLDFTLQYTCHIYSELYNNNKFLCISVNCLHTTTECGCQSGGETGFDSPKCL